MDFEKDFEKSPDRLTLPSDLEIGRKAARSGGGKIGGGTFGRTRQRRLQTRLAAGARLAAGGARPAASLASAFEARTAA